MAAEAQMERMEKELGRMRGGVRETVAEMEGREMSVNLEYEHLQTTAATLREDMHTEIERMLNEVIRFKIHVQGSLEMYEEFVSGEIEREVEEQQMRERNLLAAEEDAEGGVGAKMEIDEDGQGWNSDREEGDGDGSMSMEE